MNKKMKWIIKPLSLYDIQNADLSYLKYVIKENSVDTSKPISRPISSIKPLRNPILPIIAMKKHANTSKNKITIIAKVYLLFAVPFYHLLFQLNVS